MDNETRKIIAQLCREAAHCTELELDKRVRRHESLRRALASMPDWDDSKHIQRLVEVNLKRAELPDEVIEKLQRSMKGSLDRLFKELATQEKPSEGEASLARIGSLSNQLADKLSG